jgi:hypothetical protein
MFGRGQVSQAQFRELTEQLEARLTRQDSVIRQLEAEQLSLHAEVRRWMRRAVAAEHNATGAASRGGIRSGARERPTQDATPPPPISFGGGRVSRARLRAYSQGRLWGGGALPSAIAGSEDRATEANGAGDESEVTDDSEEQQA